MEVGVMGIGLSGRGWLGGILVALTLVALAACGGDPASKNGEDVRQARAGVAAGAMTSAADDTSSGTAERVQVRNAAAAGSSTDAGGPPPQYMRESVASAGATPAIGIGAAMVEVDANLAVAAFEEVLSGIYERSLHGVVHIRASQSFQGSQSAPGFAPLFPVPLLEGEGSGFVWSADGYVLTNQHVIGGADRVTVTFADGSEVEAEVLGTDTDSDLAVLKVEPPQGGLTPLELGDSDQVKVGHFVATIGNPFGQQFTLTSGIISALGRTIQGNSIFSIPDVIQTDAAINPGNSGGPLLDRLGRVVGINSQILSRTGSSSGIGFAVPVNLAKRVVPALIEEGRYTHAFLGLTGASLRPNMAEAMGLPEGTRGIVVVGVMEGGPVDEAGIMAVTETQQVDGFELPADGDVIVSVDGVSVYGMGDLIAYLTRNARPGDSVSLDVVRSGGERETIEVVLTARPGEEA